MSVTYDHVLEQLRELYWFSAQREICNMLLFYHELQENLGSELERPFPSCDNFRKMFDTWSEFNDPIKFFD
jgi:hypothetical protein